MGNSRPGMRLIVEPEGGIGPVLSAIDRARRSIDIVIFRLDCKSVTRGLEKAVGRGVAVRALVARKHRGSNTDLRKLERRLLRAGVVLAQTADDLTRYHGKMMIVDRQVLHVYGFNYTQIDYLSRSFGIVTTDRSLVREALKLFDADATRQSYRPATSDFVVSPWNSREQLSAFIRGARRELLVYDPRLTDPAMRELLASRANAGVDVRVIGKKRGRLAQDLAVEKYKGRRLHVRAMVRDGESAFVGSQSMGKVAFDDRREIGVIVRDRGVVGLMRSIFRRDWKRARRQRADR